MAANKRTKAQRELDLDKLAEMRLEVKSQNEMAQALGISQSQVSQDLKKLDQRWLKAMGTTDLHKAREVARLDRLERLHNEGWKRSTEDKETKVAEKTTDGEAIRTRAVSRLEKRDGNPAFLEGVRWCIAERIKLRGLATVKNGDDRPEATLRITEVVVNRDTKQESEDVAPRTSVTQRS